MKNIKIYNHKKYNNYEKIEDDIYKTVYKSDRSLSLKGVIDKSILKKLKGGLFNRVKWVDSDNELETSFLITYLGNKKYYKSKRTNDIFEDNGNNKEIYVVSISFEQEPEYGENNPSESEISQYPLEDILDKFNCFCSDFYEEENKNDKELSYVEFASEKLDNIKKIKSIIGKHVYNKKDNNKVELIIE